MYTDSRFCLSILVRTIERHTTRETSAPCMHRRTPPLAAQHSSQSAAVVQLQLGSAAVPPVVESAAAPGAPPLPLLSSSAPAAYLAVLIAPALSPAARGGDKTDSNCGCSHVLICGCVWPKNIEM